jgi:hypothetical protein
MERGNPVVIPTAEKCISYVGKGSAVCGRVNETIDEASCIISRLALIGGRNNDDRPVSRESSHKGVQGI